MVSIVSSEYQVYSISISQNLGFQEIENSPDFAKFWQYFAGQPTLHGYIIINDKNDNDKRY
jgi:hypothetical protein